MLQGKAAVQINVMNVPTRVECAHSDRHIHKNVPMGVESSERTANCANLYAKMQSLHFNEDLPSSETRTPDEAVGGGGARAGFMHVSI